MKRLFFTLLGLVVISSLGFFSQSKTKATDNSSATLNDYWQGKAAWKLRNTLTLGNTGWIYGYAGGAHMEVVDGVWYLFGQKIHWGEKCGGDKTNLDKWGIEVRVSSDKGYTWSQPTEVVVPTNGTQWDCMATDGDVYFDRESQTWHHLFQCLKGVGVWNICYLQRKGPNPVGVYTETTPNPVINSGDIWHKICDVANDHCSQIAGGPGKVAEEGTPDIFYYDGNYYYVGFHGFYNPYGFRGIAKTTNFVRNNWLAGNSSYGVPNDSVFDKYDANLWREAWQNGSIGGGAARVFYENGYFYQIIEAADINLGCVDGQNWDQGFYRTKDLTSTSWESYPFGNPVLYSSKWPEAARGGKSPACNPAYAVIFQDDITQKIYLHFTRVSEDNNFNGIFIYELVPSNNLLKNADFWMCQAAPYWQRLSPGSNITNIMVYRYPNLSSDGNCYLATNCGASTCQPGQSVYQDIDVSNISSRDVSYGGKFATDSGTGTLNLVIFESDANSTIITSHRTTLNPTPTYQSVRKNLVLNSQTKTIRFQLYLDSPHTFKADEMFFETVEPTQLSFSVGWNQIIWPDVSGKKASNTPPECPIAVAKENFWFKPYVKNFGGVNFNFESGKTYFIKCNQEVVWSF